MPAALLTLALGMIGVLGARAMDRLVAFAVIGSMGMLMAAVAVFTPDGIAAALYYALHSTLATAALFLLVDVLRDRRGAAGVLLEKAPPIAGGALVAGMFFAAAIAMTGLPPLSGFLGKLLILDAARGDGLAVWVWAMILISSLVAVVGFSRAGSVVFWKSHAVIEPAEGLEAPEDMRGAMEGHNPGLTSPILPMVAIGAVLAALVALTVAAGPVQRHLAATAAQLFAPGPYIALVLETPGKKIEYDKAKDADKADTPVAEEAH
jgi:multicomponent K+:H+ antiporter subunit D